MNFKKEFNCLAQKYNLEYRYQEFDNCFGGSWFVYTHSLFNDSGCLTIHCLPQRGEIDCYFSSKFSHNREQLCETLVNVFDIERDTWLKHQKVWKFKNPFFYWSLDRTINAILEVIEVSFDRTNEFAGLKLNHLDD